MLNSFDEIIKVVSFCMVFSVCPAAPMDRKPVNLIKSIYGIDSMGEWVSQQIEGGCKFRVYDIEKANAMLQTHGYLAEVGTQSDGSWDKITKKEAVCQ